VAPQGEHAPKAQLRERLDEVALLAAAGIPKLTEPRARQLLAGRTLDDLAHLKVFSVFGLPDGWSPRWKPGWACRATAKPAGLANLRRELLEQLPQEAPIEPRAPQRARPSS
jgi:DNA ligase (NAD+)